MRATVPTTPLVLLATLLVAMLAGGASARQAPPAPEKPVHTISEWDLPKRGEKLAIEGYDPVAYFPEGGGKPLKGRREFSHTHEGVVYRFASAAHRDLFAANPARYEPAHGGWCSWAMRDGDKTEPDPKTFIVKDDRLFLFYKGLLGNTRSSWLKKDHAESAARADRAWKTISKEEPRQVKPKLGSVAPAGG